MKRHDFFAEEREYINNSIGQSLPYVADIPVTPEFRRILLDNYPALGESRGHLRLACWLLSAYMAEQKFIDDYDDLDYPVVCPYEIVLSCYGYRGCVKETSAHELLTEFNGVVPIKVTDYNRLEGRARAVMPHWNQAVLNAWDRDLDDDAERTIWLTTGKSYSARSRKAQIADLRAERDGLMLMVSDHHPSYKLIEFLNGQSPHKFRIFLQENAASVKDAIKSLPRQNPKEIRRNRRFLSLVCRIQERPNLTYKAVSGTCRIYSHGPHPNLLRREWRRMLFSGCTELDLRSAQLAIVARQWRVKSLLRLLEDVDFNAWRYFADQIGKPVEQYKGIIKRATYAIIFGMKESGVLNLLSRGKENDEGVGYGGARRFMGIEVVRQLLEARNRQLANLEENGGGEDAFEQWHTSEDEIQVRSALAAIVQSFEMRIMLACLPVLINEGRIRVMSWLHDGATIHFGYEIERKGRYNAFVEMWTPQQTNCAYRHSWKWPTWGEGIPAKNSKKKACPQIVF